MSEKLSHRRLLRVAGLTAAATLVAACQPRVVEVEKVVKETVIVEKEVVVEKPAKPAEVTTVKFQTSWFTGSQPGQPAVWPAIIEAFEEKNPDIKIDWVEVAPAPEDVMTAVAAGTAPDVYHWYTGDLDIQQLAPRGVLMPLDDMIDASDINMDDYVPAQWEVKK